MHDRHGVLMLLHGRLHLFLWMLILVPGMALAGGSKKDDSVAPRDYMVVVNRPANLHLIDLARREILKTCRLQFHPSPGTVVMSPDNEVAYVLGNRFADVYGIELDSCDLVFSTRQSEGDERVRSMGSLAVSPDGRELYTHQVPSLLLLDRYEVRDTRVAVFDTSAGLDARPERRFPAPRQVSIMATGRDGSLYLGGPDMYRMDVVSGAVKTIIESRSLDHPLYSTRDILTFWPIGSVSREFIRMYTVAKFPDTERDMAKASWLWGYERVDLDTGEVTQGEFAPLEVVLFTGMTRPGKPNQIYAVLTQLQKFDIAQQRLVKSVDLDHSYYCINFSTNGDEIYLAGTLQDVAVYASDSLQKIGSIELPGGNMAATTPQVFRR